VARTYPPPNANSKRTITTPSATALRRSTSAAVRRLCPMVSRPPADTGAHDTPGRDPDRGGARSLVTLVSFAYYHVVMPSFAPTLDVAALASQLRLSVFRLARKLRREREAGVTPTLLAALSTIERHGPLTPSALAQHEQIKKPTC